MTALAKALVLSLAITSAIQAQAKKPAAPPPSPLQQGIALFDAERLEESKAIMAKLAAAGDAEAMFWLGRIAIEQTNGDSAVHWLEQATRLNDRSSVYYQWLGAAWGVKLTGANPFAMMSAVPTVKQVMLRAVELDSNNVEARVNLMQLYLQLPGAMGGGVDKAREQLAAIVALSPYRGRLQESALAEVEKDSVRAESALRELVASHPDSTQPVVALALLYSNRKRYDDAVRLLEDRLKRFPNEGATLYQLGRVGAVSGTNSNRAQWALTRYLKMPHRRNTPSLAAAHWRLGMVLETKGDKKTAKAEYEAALRLDPKLAGAKASLDKIK